MSTSPYVQLPSGPGAGYPQVQQQGGSNPYGGAPATQMGVPAPPDSHPANSQAAANPYPAQGAAQGAPPQDPYVNTQPAKPGMVGQLAGHVNTLGKNAENITRNVWGHLSGGHSVTHTAVGKLNNLKLLTPGSAEKYWRETFTPPPNEFFANYFSCHLSTSTGPVVGTIFASTGSLAFISDRPLDYNHPETKAITSSYYKIHVPLERVATLNSTHNQHHPNEKYLQIITVDNHQFWFLGFLSYEKAVETMRGLMKTSHEGMQQRFANEGQPGAPQGVPVPNAGQPAQGIPMQQGQQQQQYQQQPQQQQFQPQQAPPK